MGMMKWTYAGVAALLLATAAGWWIAAGDGEGVADPAARAPATAAGVLAVDSARARTIGITLGTARPASEAPLAELPATIAPPPNARVAVAANLPGMVQRTFVAMGDRVVRGQPLAVIASRDVLALGADLARANARLGVSQASAERLSRLSREGVIAGARADEAQALAAQARADVAESSRILRLVGGHGGSGTYTLTAPISGRVTRADIATGNPVDGMTAPFVIDADGQYEVTAQVPERLIGTIRPGMTVRLGDLVGTVTAVGSAIDSATRSATLRATLPPGAGVIAGRAASVTVMGPAPAGAVMVPAAAVTMIDGGPAVFVAARGGYAVRKVQTGGGSAQDVLVMRGLQPGENVVIRGTSALKALFQSR